MITPPPGWRRSIAADVLTIRPPAGGGRIRFHARLPVQRFSQLTAWLLSLEPGFVPETRGSVERLVTTDGEYAAWTLIAGHLAGAPARRGAGAVIADDFVSAIDGLETAPDGGIIAIARALLVDCSLGLGVRRRRFLYRRPPGWQAIAHGPLAIWVPPEFPRRRAMIFAYPAEPSTDEPARVADTFMLDEERRGLVRAGAVTARGFASDTGLVGIEHTYSGVWPGESQPVVYDLIVLADPTYRYALRLESPSPDENDRQALLAMARSVEPLPRPGGAPPSMASLAGHWQD